MLCCKLCRNDLSQEKRYRHLLSTVATTTKIAICSALCCEGSPTVCNVQCLEEGYICRPCHRSGQKLHNIHAKFATARQQFRDAVLPQFCISMNAHCPLSNPPPTSSTTPNPKRLRMESQTGDTTPVKIAVDYPSGPRVYQLTPSRKAMGIDLARRRFGSLAKYAVRHKDLQISIVKHIAKAIRMEIKSLCSTSILFDGQKENVCALSWRKLHNELETRTPVLYTLLRSCIPASTANGFPMTLMCISILIKANRRVATFLQKLVSLGLYTGHASKSVFEKLQKVGVCVSHRWIHKIITEIGRNHDEELLKYVQHLESVLKTEQVDENQQLDEEQFESNRVANEHDGDGGETTEEEDDEEDGDGTTEEDEEIYGYDGITEDEGSCDEDNEEITRVEDSDEEMQELDKSKADYEDADSDNSGSDDFGSGTQFPTQSNPEEPLRNQCTPFELIQSDAISNDVTIAGATVSQFCDPKTRFYFKLVGDNIDKNVKPRYMRSDNQTKSLHYFHVYAVADRVDTSQSSNQTNIIWDPQSVNLQVLLPSIDDERMMKENFCTLISRVLVKHMKHLQPYTSTVSQHILHKYSKEMSEKSQLIPLGVILKNENQVDEMGQIMEILHKYVPCQQSSDEIELASGQLLSVKYTKFLHILMGGDQLTVSRMRSVHEGLENSNCPRERLEGLVPVVEDWHAKVIFLKVIWSRLYKYASTSDRGTLYHLRNLVHRKNVRNNPEKDVNASEDFLLTTVQSHILSAAMTIFGMDSLEDQPDINMFPEHDQDIPDKTTVLKSAVEIIVHEFVDIGFRPQRKGRKQKPKDNLDHTQEYAKELLSLGLFYLEFQDAIREGDGLRVLRCWKFMFLWFRSTGHTNYTIEAMTLLTQYYFLFTPRLAEQLICSRFINTHGGLGRNIPADLHMEHLNRICKQAVAHLGANKTPASILKISHALGMLQKMMHNFDNILGVAPVCMKHTKSSDDKDLMLMVKELNKASVFDYVEGRHHQCFPKIVANVFSSIDQAKLHKWMNKQFKSQLKASFLNH